MKINFSPENFLNAQLSVWTMASANYSALDSVKEKTVEVGGMTFRFQHNPARVRSGAAKVDKSSVEARPCFLCENRRPGEQISFPAGEYEILVNPFPIFPRHFTIPLRAHNPQAIAGRIADMLRFALEMPGYTVFYNGPCCGASAPDHFHFQAVESDSLTLPAAITHARIKPVARHGSAVLSRTCGLPVNAFVVDFERQEDGTAMVESVLMPHLPMKEQEYEPRVNILCEGKRIIVIPRAAHRPSFYSIEGEGGIMVSPASVDLAGVIVLPRGEDFDIADDALIRRMLAEVCVSDSEMERICAAVSPVVNVGIMAASEITVNFDGPFTCCGLTVSGRKTIGLSSHAGMLLCNGKEIASPLEFIPYGDTSFEVEGVTIGIDFHWQRVENQRFRGSARFVIENGEVRLINIVDVEEYLVSVISSEMSANAGPEFLKAHAVISRSWLLAQIRGKRRDTVCGDMTETAEERVKWYDHDDHELFDVCADDHCQRYQGINRQTNPEVRAAVESTRGQVLFCGNELVDARFSKCCGGVMEEFSTCWQPISYPYLVARRDSEDENDYPDLRISSEAEHWINTRPRAFCDTRDAGILAQVLNSYDREDTDFYRWEVTYTREALSELVKRRSGIDFGEIIDLEPLQRGVSGRISRMLIKGTRRSMVIGKELEIRRTLSETHLKSSAFTVERNFGNDSALPDSFVLHGAGWGHGVGLCQIGAAVMGARGYAYADILRHYFVGAELKTLY